MEGVAPRVTYREEDMASYDDGEREDDGPRRAVYAPLEGHKRRAQDDHPRDNDPGHEPHEPEPLEDLRHLLEEVRALDLLLRRTPSDVVREEMREDRLRYRNGQPAKEEEAAYMRRQFSYPVTGTRGGDTHKKGTQRMFWKNAVNCKVVPVSL